MKQSTGGTTKLQERKSLLNKLDARALIELLETLGLITTIPWLAYEKLVVEPELERQQERLQCCSQQLENKSRKLETELRDKEACIKQQEDEHLKDQIQKTKEITDLKRQVQKGKSGKSQVNRTALYEELIYNLKSIYSFNDPLEELIFVYRCQLFVTGLTVLAWINSPDMLYRLLSEVGRTMMTTAGAVGELCTNELLAGREVYKENVLEAEYKSMEGMMYLIFGDELPEGLETAKKIWATIEKSEWRTESPLLTVDTDNGRLRRGTITRKPRWEIYRILLQCGSQRGRLPGTSHTDGFFLNSNSGGPLLEYQTSQKEQIPNKRSTSGTVKIEVEDEDEDD